MSCEQQTLKLEIKKWEREFKESRGRNPAKEDIKGDPVIAAKYKLYNSLKMGLLKNRTKNPEMPLTPSSRANKEYTNALNQGMFKETRPHLTTPQKTSPEQPPVPKLEFTELGPTPQLNGRVLSIFDAMKVIKATPTKNPIVVASSPEFKTPTKKKLDFSQVISDEEDSLQYSPQSKRHTLACVDSSPMTQPAQLAETPQKKSIQPANLQETPAYLRSVSHIITSSPSPLASQRINKGLTTLIREYKDIQFELKYGEYDDIEIKALTDDEPDPNLSEEGQGTEEETGDEKDKGKAIWKKKKRKGPKRQNRLVRIRALPNTEEETLIDASKNLKEQIQKLATVKEDQAMESEESEEWSDGGNEYVKQNLDFSQIKGKKRIGGISKNFKAYKLRKRGGNKNWGRRSKGW